MGALLVYSIKSGIILTIMFATYMLLMSRRKCASFRRLTMLSIYVSALTLPFLIGFISMSTAAPSLSASADVRSQAWEIPAMESPDAYSLFYVILSWILVVGMAFVILQSLSGVFIMFFGRLKGRRETVCGEDVIVIKGDDFSPFSFGGRIYIPEKDFESVPKMVLSHERSHVAHKHYLDLVFGRIVIALQWWNPFVWMMMKELKTVHEYQADMDVLEAGYDRKEYQRLLVEKASGKRIFSFANGLGYSKLKNRIIMMEREDSHMSGYAMALLMLPAAMIAVVLFSVPAMASVLHRIDAVDIFRVSPDGEALTDDDNVDVKERRVIHINGKNNERSVDSKNPAVIVDGKEVDYESMSSFDTHRIKDITVFKNRPEYPNGVIIISLLSEDEVKKRNGSADRLDDVRITGIGTVKKHQTEK